MNKTIVSYSLFIILFYNRHLIIINSDTYYKFSPKVCSILIYEIFIIGGEGTVMSITAVLVILSDRKVSDLQGLSHKICVIPY